MRICAAQCSGDSHWHASGILDAGEIYEAHCIVEVGG